MVKQVLGSLFTIYGNTSIDGNVGIGVPSIREMLKLALKDKMS
jgi:hypothetical protein